MTIDEAIKELKKFEDEWGYIPDFNSDEVMLLNKDERDNIVGNLIHVVFGHLPIDWDELEESDGYWNSEKDTEKYFREELKVTDGLKRTVVVIRYIDNTRIETPMELIDGEWKEITYARDERIDRLQRAAIKAAKKYHSILRCLEKRSY